MADQSDVENALVAAISAALYPNGPPQPNEISPVTNNLVTISRGWPDPQSLDAVLNEGLTWVTVWPGPLRDTTRYVRQWQVVPQPVPT